MSSPLHIDKCEQYSRNVEKHSSVLFKVLMCVVSTCYFSTQVALAISLIVEIPECPENRTKQINSRVL